MFFLFVGNADIAKVPGLSAAGANVDVLPYTSSLKSLGQAPESRGGRAQSHPSPAIITRAAVLCADIPVCVVRVGTMRPPAPPYVEMGVTPAGDPRFGAAVPCAEKIFDDAAGLARNLTGDLKRVMIAESVPGGTTTALLVLRALGYDVMVSSSGTVNPISLKEQMWIESSERAGIKAGDLRSDPMRAIRELGDQMQAAVLGFINGINKETEVALAGGTQMLAVAACLRAMGDSREMTVATTKYVALDKSASFHELGGRIGVKTYDAPLDFSKSPHKGLRDYEAGYVKEGVGAVGSVLYASWKGVGVEKIVARTNELYQEIIDR